MTESSSAALGITQLSRLIRRNCYFKAKYLIDPKPIQLILGIKSYKSLWRTMYEVFLTAFVEDSDFAPACSVLGGLCSMKPWESISRVLYFQGPPRPTGLSNQSSIEKPIRKNIAPLWKELHQNLSRQSFIVQGRYDLIKDRDMGPSAKPIDLNTTAGVLRWADFPDPPRGEPLLTQRKMVELWEQRNIPSILYDNNYRYVDLEDQ